MAKLYHYTDKKGYNGIRANKPWKLEAHEPPGEHPFGTYFTDSPPDTPNLANKLYIPKRKLEYVFCFADKGDLLPLPNKRGGYNARGEHIFYSPDDYYVDPDEPESHCGKADEL